MDLLTRGGVAGIASILVIFVSDIAISTRCRFAGGAEES
jgi:hypothetical protein